MPGISSRIPTTTWYVPLTPFLNKPNCTNQLATSVAGMPTSNQSTMSKVTNITPTMMTSASERTGSCSCPRSCSCGASAIFLRLWRGPRFAQKLLRVGGDNLILEVRRDDLDSYMPLTGEEQAAADLRGKQEELFGLGQVEGLDHDVNGRRRLLQEQLQGGVGDDRPAERRPQEVLHVLGDGGHPQIVFAGAFHQTEQEGGRVLVLHHDPGLVHDQDAFLELGADEVPDEVQDHIHGHRAQFLFQVADGEDYQAVRDIYVRRLIYEAGEAALRVFVQTLRHAAAAFQVPQDRLQVGKQRRFLLGEVLARHYLARGVGLGKSVVEKRVLVRGQCAEHELQQAGQVHDVRAQDFRRLFALGDNRDVERVHVRLGGQRYVEEATPEALGQALVFVLRVDDQDVHAHHELADNLQFGRVAFAAAGFGEDDLVRVLQRETVEDDQAVVVLVHAVHDALVGSQVLGHEREKGGQRPGIHRRLHVQVILGER